MSTNVVMRCILRCSGSKNLLDLNASSSGTFISPVAKRLNSSISPLPLSFPTIHNKGDGPGVIFCHGLGSSWDCPKPLGIEEHMKKRGGTFTRFQYRFVEDQRKVWHIDNWVEDILNMMSCMDRIYGEPQIYIGASAGCQALLRAAIVRPESVRGLLLFAPGVGIDLSYIETISPGSIPRLHLGDLVTHPGVKPELDCMVNLECLQSYLDNCPLTQALFTRKRIALDCPIKIVHGMQDILVPYTNSLRLAEFVESNQVEIVLLKNGHHMFPLSDSVIQALDHLIDDKTYAQQREKLYASKNNNQQMLPKKTYLRMVNHH